MHVVCDDKTATIRQETKTALAEERSRLLKLKQHDVVWSKRKRGRVEYLMIM